MKRKTVIILCAILIVCLGVLLVEVVLPALNSSTNRRRENACLLNFSQIRQALSAYRNKWDNQLPPDPAAAGLQSLFRQETPGNVCLVCPAAAALSNKSGGLPPEQCNYFYLGPDAPDGRCPVVVELPRSHSRSNPHILFADGTIEKETIPAGIRTVPELLATLAGNAATPEIRQYLNEAAKRQTPAACPLPEQKK